MIQCQHCGRQIPYDANLCPYCGRSIKKFHQKPANAEDEQTIEDQHDDKQEVILPRQPREHNDRRLLFFIIAVLALLLIAGAIYHYSSAKSEDDDLDALPTDTAVAKDIPDTEETKDTKDAKDAKTPVPYNAKKKQQVVVDGDGVRLRFGPSLQAGYLKDEKGATKSVKKGTRLECVGESGDWYQVVYMNKRYYMSKQYTYLVE